MMTPFAFGLEDESYCEPPSCEVEVSPNAVVGVLYGATGEVLAEVHERASVPFGFRPRGAQ